MEHEKTYRFVEEVSRNFAPVTVLERAPRGPEGARDQFRIVDIKTCARDGEPFETLNEEKGFLPNPVARICTSYLKIKTMEAFARSLGWKRWTVAIGIRADEPKRVARVRGGDWDNGYDRVMPLADADVCLEDVTNFWSSFSRRDDGFDLGFPTGDNILGNCVGCFLKGRRRLDSIARMEPTALQWWADQEEKLGAFFRTDRPSYRQIMLQAKAQPMLFDDDETLPCDCHN